MEHWSEETTQRVDIERGVRTHREGTDLHCCEAIAENEEEGYKMREASELPGLAVLIHLEPKKRP